MSADQRMIWRPERGSQHEGGPLLTAVMVLAVTKRPATGGVIPRSADG